MELNNLLEKCTAREELDGDEIAYLLTREGPQREAVFEAARQTREQYFGKKVFLYGFVYFSTYCKNNCTFCYYRRDNSSLPRYRKEPDEVVKTAKELAASGIHLVDLTTGDDPYYTNNPERLAEIITSVKQETGLPVMVSPGVLDPEGIRQIRRAGADWYALYQETYCRELFDRLRIGQSYDERMNAKLLAKETGMLIEEGLLVGVGDSVEDRVQALQNMKTLGASQVRTMTFIPQQGAPLAGEGLDSGRELMTIAVMRLLFPDALIPASLDVEGLDGLQSRLQAGANVVTSIIPPKEGYMGVASSRRDIDDGYRTVSGIQETLRRCGLAGASAAEYREWITERKRLS